MSTSHNLSLGLNSKELHYNCYVGENWKDLDSAKKIFTVVAGTIATICWPLLCLAGICALPVNTVSFFYHKWKRSKAIKVLNNGINRAFEQRKINQLDRKINTLTSKIEKYLKKINNQDIVNDITNTSDNLPTFPQSYWNEFPGNFSKTNLRRYHTHVPKEVFRYKIKLNSLINLRETYSKADQEERSLIINNLALMSFVKNSFKAENQKELLIGSLLLMNPIYPVYYINKARSVKQKYQNNSDFFAPLTIKPPYEDLVTAHNELTKLDYIQPYYAETQSKYA